MQDNVTASVLWFCHLTVMHGHFKFCWQVYQLSNCKRSIRKDLPASHLERCRPVKVLCVRTFLPWPVMLNLYFGETDQDSISFWFLMLKMPSLVILVIVLLSGKRISFSIVFSFMAENEKSICCWSLHLRCFLWHNSFMTKSFSNNNNQNILKAFLQANPSYW